MPQHTKNVPRRAGGGGLMVSLALLVQGWLLLAGARALSLTRRPNRSEAGVIAEYVAMGAFGVVAAVALWAGMKALGLDVIDAMRDNILGGN